MEKSGKTPERLHVVRTALSLARLLAFVSPERGKNTPDHRLDRLVYRLANVVESDDATSPLARRGYSIDNFLQTFKQQTEDLDAGRRAVGKLSFFSTMDKPVVASLIRNVNASLCGRPDVQSEQGLHNLMYYPAAASKSAETPPYKVLDKYEDFDEPYAVMGEDARHRRSIVLPVIDDSGWKTPGTYVEYSSGSLGNRNGMGSLPFHITFVVLPQSTRIAPP